MQMPFSFWASVPVSADADHGAIFLAATGRFPDDAGYGRPVYFEGRLYIPGVAQDVLNGAAPGAPPLVRYLPVPLVRERLEAVGRWDDLAALLVSQPAIMLKVLTLTEGIAADDQQARDLISAAGADPAEILAP
jgi:hypothetical protein